MTVSKVTLSLTDTGVLVEWPSGYSVLITPSDRSSLQYVPVRFQPEIEEYLATLSTPPSQVDPDPDPDPDPELTPKTLAVSVSPVVSSVDPSQLVSFIQALVAEVRIMGVHAEGSTNFGKVVAYPRLERFTAVAATADSVESMIWRIAKEHGVRRQDAESK